MGRLLPAWLRAVPSVERAHSDADARAQRWFKPGWAARDRTRRLTLVLASLAIVGPLLQVMLAVPTGRWLAMAAISAGCAAFGTLLYAGIVHSRRAAPPSQRESGREHDAGARPCPAREASPRHPDEMELRSVNQLAVVGRLTAEMVHEFGTPLGVILARAGMIVADDVDLVEAQRDAQAILVQVRRMTELCRTVLDYARPQSPARTPERVDLVSTAQQTLKLLGLEARKRRVKLELEGQPVPTFVLGDASKFAQILTNLVVNAMESMPHGGAVRLHVQRVHTTAMEREDGELAEYACVRVRDQGTGVDPNELPHLFEPFFTSKRAQGGSGLGLAISQRIAREYGGWLSVLSSADQGSCFSLYVPLLEAAA